MSFLSSSVPIVTVTSVVSGVSRRRMENIIAIPVCTLCRNVCTARDTGYLPVVRRYPPLSRPGNEIIKDTGRFYASAGSSTLRQKPLRVIDKAAQPLRD